MDQQSDFPQFGRYPLGKGVGLAIGVRVPRLRRFRFDRAQ